MFCAVSTEKVQNCSKKQHCESNPPDTKLFKRQNHVRLSHVIQHSPTSCAQFTLNECQLITDLDQFQFIMFGRYSASKSIEHKMYQCEVFVLDLR